MSMEDPFFVVKGEVQKAVSGAQSLHRRWSQLLPEGAAASKEELDWTTNELRNSLRSIEWDLEDLDETINILSGGAPTIRAAAARRQLGLHRGAAASATGGPRRAGAPPPRSLCSLRRVRPPDS
uniref:Syntaxin 10 n=1 Tax=Hippocampus comes TaxID=109280 RepID=A0A3Q2Z806_HIPCM